jgi:predicted DNA-binding transcriptional regulator AlpA
MPAAPVAPPQLPDDLAEWLPGPALRRRIVVSRVTVWRWTSEPDFPRPAVVGGLRLYHYPSVVAWLRARAARGAA